MGEPIRYHDRATRTTQTEQIYGERWLRLAYETAPGRSLVWLVFRRAWFSRWYGWRMDRPASASRVVPFIRRYGVDAAEFADAPETFATFNEFFYRRLKPGARPLAAPDDPRVAVLPADGRHLAFPDVEAAAGFYAKGARFTLTSLLGDAALAAEFAGGAMLISRLCPVDYHRFHFPVAGTPGAARLVNGWLYSVSPIALRRNVGRLVENKRLVTLVDSPEFGRVAVLEIGATNVGTVRQTFAPGRAVAKGDEKGFFAFGGSCVVTLFQRGRIRLDADLIAPSAACTETYAKMGERLGEAAGA
jgi:phosphatidylserine decarboxylase